MKSSKILASLLLGAGATLLGTTVQAQILITGGTLVFFDNNPNTFPNAPVAGYLETAQGRIQSANFSFEDARGNPGLFETIIPPGNPGSLPVLLQMKSAQNRDASMLELLASGMAYTPNGPVLFSGIDVTVRGNHVDEQLQLPPITLDTHFGRFEDVWYIDKYTVTGGQFGSSATIIDNNGNTVSLAPDRFHFTDPFPTPLPLPSSPPSFTDPTPPPTEALIPLPIPDPTPTEALIPLPIPEPLLYLLPVEVKTISDKTINPDRFSIALNIDLTPETPKIIRLIQRGRSPRVTRLVPITEDNYRHLNLVQ
ncbi:MAG: hypothetical protein AB4290_03105 [Spirulina sp.]